MVAGQGGGGGREGGRESGRVTRGRGACECACGQVAVRVRVRVHMQESARTRTCCRRCVRVFVLWKCACLCGGKACGHVHARAEQRQVLIPGGVERHHAARGRVGERKRVGGGCDGSCYANSTAMRRLVRSGGPKILFRKQKLRTGLLCGSGLRCVAFRNTVAGKFASILICGLDSSCVTHSHNLLCVFAFLMVREFSG